jgi:hypothetical protein
MEFCADLVGAGVVEFVEDGQGVSPSEAGAVEVVGGVVGVAEVDDAVGLVVAVAEVVVQVDGVLVAGDGPGVVAEVLVGVAETVPRLGQTAAVIEFLVQSESLLAVDEGLLVAAEEGMLPGAPPGTRTPNPRIKSQLVGGTRRWSSARVGIAFAPPGASQTIPATWVAKITRSRQPSRSVGTPSATSR